MEILRAIIGIVLALLFAAVIIGPLKDALSKDTFIDQIRKIGVMVESLEQDDSKTMLIDFSNKNALFFLNAGSARIEYSRSVSAGLPFSEVAAIDSIPKFQNYVRDNIKSRDPWSASRDPFKDECPSGTCLCLCTEWKSDDSKKQDNCNAKYHCFPFDNGITVSPIPGVKLIDGNNNYFWMLGGQVFFAGSQNYGPQSIVISGEVSKKIQEGEYEIDTTEKIPYNGRILLRAERYFDTVALCFSKSCFTQDMRKFAEWQYVAKNQQNMDLAINFLLSEGKTREAFDFALHQERSALLKNVRKETLVRLLSTIQKVDLAKSSLENLLSFVYVKDKICSMSSAILILDLEKMDLEANKEAYKLYSDTLISFFKIKDSDSSKVPCTELKPIAAKEFTLDKYAEVLGQEKDSIGRLYQIYYWFERGKICNEDIECIGRSQTDPPFFNRIIDLVGGPSSNNVEVQDPFRLYYYAAKIQKVALQWRHFSEGMIYLNGEFFVNGKSLDPQPRSPNDWISDLDSLQSEIDTYYEDIRSSARPQLDKSIAQQAKLQFAVIVRYEKARVHFIMNDFVKFKELREGIKNPVLLPVISEVSNAQAS